jgi:hypothetical protein
MGARWYDPGEGDFTSADTVSVSPDPDPAAGNPFAYAADEPLDLVDPTGHYIVPPPNAGTSERVGNGVSSPSNYVADVATARVVEQAVITAPNDAAKAAAAHAAIARVEAEQATARKAAVAAAAREAAQEKAREEAEARAKAKAAAEKSQLSRAAAAEKAMLDPGDSSQGGGAGRTVSDVFGWLGKGGDLLNEGADWADQATGINSAVSCATDPSVGGCEQAAGAVTMAVAAAFTDGTTEALEPAMGTIEESADGLAEDIESDLCEGGQSFSAGTKVLLASGAAIAIDTLRPGDRVLATNTKTGKTTAETVAAVLVHHDTDLYDLTVKTSHGTEVIDTTSSHLFWDPYLDKWVTANKLSKGEHLKTPDGTLATADGGITPKRHDGWMWDLTVPGNNDHDFYVETAEGAVLVHNASSAYVPPPAGKILPGFPNAKYIGNRGGRATWTDGKTTLQWDYQHGAVEKYSKNGTHLGEFDPNDGSQNKPGDPSRSPSGC